MLLIWLYIQHTDSQTKHHIPLKMWLIPLVQQVTHITSIVNYCYSIIWLCCYKMFISDNTAEAGFRATKKGVFLSLNPIFVPQTARYLRDIILSIHTNGFSWKSWDICMTLLICSSGLSTNFVSRGGRKGGGGGGLQYRLVYKTIQSPTLNTTIHNNISICNSWSSSKKLPCNKK